MKSSAWGFFRSRSARPARLERDRGSRANLMA